MMTPAPDPAPILSAEYDYYTIWGYFRGIDPDTAHRRDEICGVLDLEGAYDAGILDQPGHAAMLSNVQSRLRAIGLDAARIQEYEFAVSVGTDGTLRRNERGAVDVRLCIDALTAYEHQLLTEEGYRELLGRVEEKLEAVGCEKLDLKGNHLLLSMDPDGRFKIDARGEIAAFLCNFELIRGPTTEMHTGGRASG